MNANLSIYDQFLAGTGPDRLQKILARYELFRMVMDVPGDIAECGVFKGSGFYTWAKLLRLFKPHNEIRLIGFDFFDTDRSMHFEFQQDKDCLDEHAQNWSSQDVIRANCAAWGLNNVDLIAGNVVETTQKFAAENLGTRLSLLYIDVDNYEGALGCLRNLYPLLSVGGIVALDEYALRGYGESNAVDEYFKGQKIKIRSLPWANTPTAYIVKEHY
ncbi:MAG: class I SAM-dependent methyltransferase [Alphaproteobacteria bacterium]|nr:class I SAM-dependent methyltransferase [Alphaproteobacteria bacterium]